MANNWFNGQSPVSSEPAFEFQHYSREDCTSHEASESSFPQLEADSFVREWPNSTSPHEDRVLRMDDYDLQIGSVEHRPECQVLAHDFVIISRLNDAERNSVSGQTFRTSYVALDDAFHHNHPPILPEIDIPEQLVGVASVAIENKSRSRKRSLSLFISC